MKQIELRFTAFSYAITKLLLSFRYLLMINFKSCLEHNKRYVELINTVINDNIHIVEKQVELERLNKGATNYLECKIDLLSLQYECKNDKSLLIEIDKLNGKLQIENYLNDVKNALINSKTTLSNIQYLIEKTKELKDSIFDIYTDVLYMNLMNDLMVKYFDLKYE